MYICAKNKETCQGSFEDKFTTSLVYVWYMFGINKKRYVPEDIFDWLFNSI